MELVAGGVVLLVVAVGLYLIYQQQLGNPRGTAKRFAASAVTELGAVDGTGVHRLAGLARPVGDPPTSPVSGRHYLALDVLVQAHSDGVSRRTRRTAVDFLLDDGTGVALVRAGSAEVPVEHDYEHPATTLDQVPFADEVLRAGGVTHGSPTTCQVRMFEGVMVPGAAVGVLGHVEAADAEARAAGASWVVHSADGVPLLVRVEAPTA